jgi:hypothetical protein
MERWNGNSREFNETVGDLMNKQPTTKTSKRKNSEQLELLFFGSLFHPL